MFDIVQHLGLFYHLRDPFLSLSQARSCIKTGGTLLMETNVIMDRDESFMLYNGIPSTYRISDNYSVWWSPTVSCLNEMLVASLFEPDSTSIKIVELLLVKIFLPYLFYKKFIRSIYFAFPFFILNSEVYNNEFLFIIHTCNYCF